jgi:mono/diheme cytochrome c family protein
MRRLHLVAVTMALSLAGGSAALATQTPQEHQHPAEGTHHHPEAAKLKNPVPADASSLAAGKKVYDSSCSQCHGATGLGDGKMAAMVNPKPSNLADDEWKHGSSDGEIFVVIRDGVKGTGMKGFASKMTEHEMWDVVNYVRSLAPKPSH